MRGFAHQRAFDDILHQMSPHYTLYNEGVVTFLFSGENSWWNGVEGLKTKNICTICGQICRYSNVKSNTLSTRQCTTRTLV